MVKENELTSQSLSVLVEPAAGPCVSLHLPMQVRGAETQQNNIVLKNALREARQQLRAVNVEGELAEDILAPLQRLLHDTEFWQNQGAGLALYARPRAHYIFRLGVSLQEGVHVGDRFTILPLLAELDRGHNAYVLQLSDNHVALWRWSHGELKEQAVPNLPKDRDGALQLDFEQSLQGHVVAQGGETGAPVEGVHGQGRGKDKEDAYRREFIQKVHSAVKAFLGERDLPLVLATVERNFSEFKKINQCPGLEDQYLRGNFDGSPSEVVAQITPLLEERHQREQESALQGLREEKGGSLFCEDFDEVCRAAVMARIEKLYVPWPAPQMTGRWPAQTLEVEIDDEPQAGRDWLLDIVGMETFRHDGVVCFLAEENWISSAPAIAQLRWTNDS